MSWKSTIVYSRHTPSSWWLETREAPTGVFGLSGVWNSNSFVVIQNLHEPTGALFAHTNYSFWPPVHFFSFVLIPTYHTNGKKIEFATTHFSPWGNAAGNRCDCHHMTTTYGFEAKEKGYKSQASNHTYSHVVILLFAWEPQNIASNSRIWVCRE